MSKILLAMMAFLFLVGQLGFAEAPACQVSNLTQSIKVDNDDPCSSNEQTIHLIKVHTCDCGSILLPIDALDTAVPPRTDLSFDLILWPQTAVTQPSTPPPRLI